MPRDTNKALAEDFSGTKTNKHEPIYNSDSWIIAWYQHTGTKNLKEYRKPQNVVMRIFDLVMTRKMDINCTSISGIVLRFEKLNEKALKINIVLGGEFNAWKCILQIINIYLLSSSIVIGVVDIWVIMVIWH